MVDKKDIEALLRDVDSYTLPAPMSDFNVGEYYYYKAGGGLFNKDFSFRVLEDRKDEYWILIENQVEGALPKDFDLLEAVEIGEIISLGLDLYKEKV